MAKKEASDEAAPATSDEAAPATSDEAAPIANAVVVMSVPDLLATLDLVMNALGGTPFGLRGTMRHMVDLWRNEGPKIMEYASRIEARDAVRNAPVTDDAA